MHEPSRGAARRERFFDRCASPTEAAAARALLPVLLHQDGSTTRLLEAITGGPIQVQVLHQHEVDALPAALHGVLPGTRFLRRLTALCAHGEVLLDSLAYIALDGLPPDIAAELHAGQRPIGHLLAKLWTRRRFGAHDAALLEELWRTVGRPDAQASRSCVIDTPVGACMVLAETFRAGIASPRRPADTLA